MDLEEINEALLRASSNGNLDDVKKLVDNGANSLIFAAYLANLYGHIEIAKYLNGKCDV